MYKPLLSACGFFLCLLGSSGLASAGTEYVYIGSNLKAPGANSIYAFVRTANGGLNAVNGSPFLTGGAGVQDSSLALGPYDSDQNIAIDANRRLLFAVNSGSDSIAVLHINDNGSLRAVENSPFPSGGTDPVSVAVSGDLLFVVNKNGDFPRQTSILPNYTVFRISADGNLSQVPDSTVSVAVGSSPTQAFLPGEGGLLFGADFLGGLLQQFKFDNEGHLKQRPPLGLPPSEFDDTKTPRLPLGLWAHPKLPILYVGFVTANKLGVYRFSENGHLTFIRTVPNSGTAICWLRTDRAGLRLYSSDTGTNSISVYNLSDPESPVEIQNLVLNGIGNVLQFSLSDDERNLYAITQRGSASIAEGEGNTLHILAVEGDGTVSETKSPLVFHFPAGTRPQGVAVFSTR